MKYKKILISISTLFVLFGCSDDESTKKSTLPEASLNKEIDSTEEKLTSDENKELSSVITTIENNSLVEEVIIDNKNTNENNYTEKEKNIENESLENQKDEGVKAYSGDFYIKNYYDSRVLIYITGPDETVMSTLGEVGKLEKLKDLTLPNEVAKINLGLFDNTFEHGGMYMENGIYIQPPHTRYNEIIKYKDGRIKIGSYDPNTISEETIERLKEETDFVAGASYPLIRNGKVDLGNAKEYSHYNQRNPRSLFGQRADGRYILVVVEGRSESSKGVTAEQSANIMKELGAVEAINLDGGGSSELYINGGLMNDMLNEERKIGSALIVIKK